MIGEYFLITPKPATFFSTCGNILPPVVLPCTPKALVVESFNSGQKVALAADPMLVRTPEAIPPVIPANLAFPTSPPVLVNSTAKSEIASGIALETTFVPN